MSAAYLPHLFSQTLCVPLSENADKLQAELIKTSDGQLLMGFSHALHLVEFLGSHRSFTELAPQAVIALALEQGASFGFDLGQDHGVILSKCDLDQISKILKTREAIEEIDDFDFVSGAFSDELRSEIENTLPENVEAWLVQDREKGALLVVHQKQFTDENEGFNTQLALRQLVLGLQNTQEIRLIVFPHQHPKWTKLKDEILSLGLALQVQKASSSKAVPILKW